MYDLEKKEPSHGYERESGSLMLLRKVFERRHSTSISHVATLNRAVAVEHLIIVVKMKLLDRSL